ncbi:hypothetical protein ACFQ7N_39660 [Streptomyces niveus]|uniref:hypothetical protein n=1 Tax=Streptomyces niveus TaxID=193462 RepID=UPI003689CFB0
MLTVADLVNAPSVSLRYAHAPDPAATRAAEAQLVGQVELCGDGWDLPVETAPRVQDVLAIVPDTGALLSDPGAVLRRLAERGVIAVAVAASSPESLTDGVVRAAGTARVGGLALLVTTCARAPYAVQADLLRRLLVAERRSGERRERLSRLAAALDRQGEGPGPYLRRLGDECGAEVEVIEPDHPRWDRLAAELGTVLTQVRSGHLDTAIAELHTGEQVILHAVGGTAPHPVLAAVRERPWPRPLRNLVAAATGTVTRLTDPLDLRAAEKRLLDAEARVRVSVWQLLMRAETVTAELAVEPLVPGLLADGRCRVAVVECKPKEDRWTVAKECEKAVGSRALVVRCPTEDRHVIIVMAADEAQNLTETLEAVARSGRATGISTPEPWTRTASAYDAAVRALVTARQTSTSISVHDGRTPLAAHLPPGAAHWARAFLRPLDELPHEQRGRLVHTARLALAYGALSAGRLVGCDRTTARKRLAVVMTRLGLNHSQLPDRAVADLALQIAETHVPGAPHPGSPQSLHAIFDEADAARQEARRFLAPLDGDAYTLELLIAWIRSNCHIQTAASEQGISRNTLAGYLEKAGAQLASPLSPPGSGAHGVFFALVLTGRLPVKTIPDPAAALT